MLSKVTHKKNYSLKWLDTFSQRWIQNNYQWVIFPNVPVEIDQEVPHGLMWTLKNESPKIEAHALILDNIFNLCVKAGFSRTELYIYSLRNCSWITHKVQLKSGWSFELHYKSVLSDFFFFFNEFVFLKLNLFKCIRPENVWRCCRNLILVTQLFLPAD